MSLTHLISLSKFNLPLIGTFTWPTPPGPYRATTCRGRELNYGSHNTFLTTQGHGGPPWISDQLNAGATSETSRTLKTIHSLIHYNKVDLRRVIMLAKWYSRNVGLKFPDICLTGEEKSWKTSPRKLVPTGDRTWARMLPPVPQRWTEVLGDAIII